MVGLVRDGHYVETVDGKMVPASVDIDPATNLPTAAASSAVLADILAALQSDESAIIGATNETKAASSAATSGLNGLLKLLAFLLETKLPVDYEPVAASQTDQILGATGAVGDYLSHLLIIPATTGAGNVSIKDGNGSSISVFVSGTLPSLVPFVVPWGGACVNSTTPGWKVTTGANVSAVGFGNFT